MDQIELHKKIDDLINAGPACSSFEDVKKIISINEDARNYFFATAGKNWLAWLWENGFLDAIKKKSEDQNQYSYTLPELQYLVTVSEKEPMGVTDIMLEVPISEQKLNPEVLGRFIWICGSLPADQISRIVGKIREEGWAKLMRRFNHFGFEYDKMLERLYEIKDWKNILILAEVILAIRTKDELSDNEKTFGTENPFYFKDLGQIKIFKYLVDVDDENLERALALVARIMRQVVLMQTKENKSKVFDMADSFGFYDIDFFTLKLDDGKHLSYRDDVENLAATMKALTRRLIGSKCSKPEIAKNIYDKYIDSLPFSHSMWRFRLYVLTLCPEVFQKEIKEAFFKFFDSEGSYDLILGAEYEQSLKKCFSILSKSDKELYIKKVLDFFGTRGEDEKDKGWHKYKGRQIFACIIKDLASKEIEIAEKILGRKIDSDYKPEPSIVHGGMAGMISPKAPVELDDLQKKTITEIVENLCHEWSPENIRKIDVEDNFYHPLNARGMGDLLKEDIGQRFELYVDNAELFFNKGKLDEHYTYTFLQGICEGLRKNEPGETANFNKLLILIENIVATYDETGYEKEEEKRRKADTWLADWRAVYYVMADVIKELLGENKDKATINLADYRHRLLNIIKSLLLHFDPGVKTNEKEYENDPYSIAINSVRGRAFQTFVLFAFRDGQKFSKEDKIKISQDVKDIYEEVLNKENTYAVMFLYGHYLASFFYRDRKWMLDDILPKIFSEKVEKHDLYIAAWEGYISANIYGDMFSEFGSLYERAIKLDPGSYTKRKYHKDLDDGLATHLALAYVHFSDFDIESKLFKMFWEAKIVKRHEEFVSFVGRHAISRNNALGFIKENKVGVEKIKKLWNWILENIEEEGVFSKFGFWIDKEQNVFETKWLVDHVLKTLAKSKGETNWDYGLRKALPGLAEKMPVETLKILRVYLLDQYLNNSESFRNSVYVDDLLDAFKIIYANNKTKAGAYDLINDLILAGSSRFWKLKEVLNNTKK